ncbi:MAG: 5'-nucleotidase, lipoprotein e(P4) family [Salinivirgaceae bacterium]
MKQLILLLVLVSIFGCKPELKNANPSLSESEHLVMATNWFQKSAEMRANYYQTFTLAKYKLTEKQNAYKGSKPTAVVLDIDETVLDNSPFEVNLINTGQLYSGKLWQEWTSKGAAKALPGAVDFTQYAKSLGVEVVYISNRKTNELEITLENLKSEGFPNADSIFVFLRPMDKSGDKTERRSFVNNTYNVLLYIGDNLTDFSQVYGERGADLGFSLVDSTKNLFGEDYIILPNPMYGEWEGALYGNDYSLSPEQKRNLRKQLLDGY